MCIAHIHHFRTLVSHSRNMRNSNPYIRQSRPQITYVSVGMQANFKLVIWHFSKYMKFFKERIKLLDRKGNSYHFTVNLV